MGLRMIEPWENPRSDVYWFRRRIPVKLVGFMGRTELKFSLKTKNWDEAVLLCNEENLKLERMWYEHLHGRTHTELTQLQVAALAGEFYRETVAAHRDNPGKPSDWENSLRAHENRKRRRFSLVPRDYHYRITFGKEAHEFLGKRGLSLVGDTFDGFVNAYVAAKGHAESQLKRNAERDYTPDPKAASYPDFQPVVKFQALWDEYLKKKKKSAATIKKWEPYFRILIRRIGTDDMRKVTEKHLLDWRDELEDRPDLSAVTIKNGYMAAMKSFFGWAKLKKRLPVDPSAEVYVETSTKTDAEKMRGFNDNEADIILSATLAPFSRLMSPENAAARRWIPWLCAYTGARVNEMTQLRASDIKEVDGLWCVCITPAAGSVKNRHERMVPLHPHLVDQGFVEFARQKKGDTPLFYSLARQRGSDRKNPTYVSVGNKLAEWVVGLGIDDPLVMPNHGWRHRFKTIGRKVKMNWLILDAIQGHAPRTEGEKYGVVPPDVMYSEILKHPRYEVIAATSVDRRSKIR